MKVNNMAAGYELDTSLLPKEFMLLLSILKLEGKETQQSVNEHQSDEWNWDLFLQLAIHHRVYPAIHTQLQQHKIAWIPPRVLQTLYKEYKRNTFEMLKLSAETELLCGMLEEAGIRTLMLKGPTLAVDLYGDISQRTSGDLDMLVPMEDLENAEALLGKQGYVKDEYIQTVLNDWKWRHHHVTFFHFQKRIKVEVHWRLGPGPGKEPGFEQMWLRKRKSGNTQGPVYCLGREDLFLFLVSHGARHGWSRLRWLADIDRIVRQEVQLNQLTFRLKENQQTQIAAQALVLASQLLNTPLPGAWHGLSAGRRGQRLAQAALFYLQQMVNLHSEPVPEPVAKYHKRHMFSLLSLYHKLLFVMTFFFPYPEDAETLKLPKSLHFLYFPLRPFLWAWRKTKKLTVSQGGTS